jgi:hypothetical protein
MKDLLAINIFCIILGFLLIVGRKDFANYIMSAREEFFKNQYSNELKKKTQMVPLIIGIIIFIYGIYNLIISLLKFFK